MGLIDWIWGKPQVDTSYNDLLKTLDTESNKPKKTLEDHKPPELWIERGIKLVGLIVSAEKIYSKSSGRPFIKLGVEFNRFDKGHLYMNRFDYSRGIMQLGWEEPKSEADEAKHIASMVGMYVRVRCSIVRGPNDMFYNAFRFVEFTKEPTNG